MKISRICLPVCVPDQGCVRMHKYLSTSDRHAVSYLVLRYNNTCKVQHYHLPSNQRWAPANAFKAVAIAPPALRNNNLYFKKFGAPGGYFF